MSSDKIAIISAERAKAILELLEANSFELKENYDNKIITYKILGLDYMITISYYNTNNYNLAFKTPNGYLNFEEFFSILSKTDIKNFFIYNLNLFT